MKKAALVLGSLLLIVQLTACQGSTEDGILAEEKRLDASYADALAVPTQLALGSLRLEETDLTIGEGQAAELLPLWQAYQTLSTSDKAAEVEVEALLNQLRDIMSAEQIEAIATMELTAEDAAAWMQEQSGGLGRGSTPGFSGAGADRGGEPPGSGGARAGGAPGIGSRDAGALPGSGGQPGEGDQAARTAEGIDSANVNAMMDHVVVSALIESLQTGTGTG